MPTGRIKISFICLLFIFPVNKAICQGKINAPAIECLGNVTNFSYTAPSGLTLSSASWNFGDGFNSTNSSPSHKYINTGKFRVVIQVTFTNSSSRTDSVNIEVKALPKAGFYMDVKTDSCLHRNKVCYIDTSRPAKNGQDITKRLFVWGDGTFSQNSAPVYGQKICHAYGLPDKYDLRMEVTDTFGCKNSVPTTINIIDDIYSNFKFKQQFVNCSTLQVCVLNLSYGDTTRRGNYEWRIDTVKMDTASAYTGFKCVNVGGIRKSSISLVAYFTKNCIDTFTKPLEILVDPLPKKLDLLDTVVCFSSTTLNEATFVKANADTILWYIDNGFDPYKSGNHIYFETRIMPGIHQVKAALVRGYCTTTLVNNFTVRGPFAKIEAIDKDQCFSNRQVYFVDDSKGIDRKDCIFFWNIRDPAGESCTSSRAKNINTYKNCNFSTDWYTKHKFTDKSKTGYTIGMYVKDTVSGCDDSGYYSLDMKYCSPLLKMDSVVICQGKRFLEDIPPPYPIEFIVDTASKFWRSFPSAVDSPLLGIYTTGLKFRSIVSPWAETIGNDSLRIHNDSAIYYDTVYLKDFMHIKAKKSDSIWHVLHGNCKPLKLSIHFKKGIFNPGDSIFIYWGDETQGMRFNSFTKLDSVMHTYPTTGIQGEILVKLINKEGCATEYRFTVEKGKFVNYRFKPTGCMNQNACFYPNIYEIIPDNIWTYNIPKNQVTWEFDDTTGLSYAFFACHKFKTPGVHHFKMMVKDSFGCFDTLQDKVFIQGPHADVKRNAKFIYCSELKQFFDSSSIIPYPGDSIKRYAWRFGPGGFSSLQKNPLQSINTSLDKIPAAHMIETAEGCLDTFFFEIEVIGPKPYFLIRDTIGCGSLNAEFVNLSRNCSQYIWQFGDSAQNTLQVSDKQTVNFLYKKPGRYFISLIGIDSVYNPFTQKLQYCAATFPDKVFQPDTTRSVLVLPYRTTGISSVDTICAGSSVLFSSKSDPAYDFDYWKMDDTSFTTNAGSAFSYKFAKTGLYTIKLNPGYTTAINNQCRDSAQKSILVLGIKADFDIDPGSIAPEFLFHNKSNPGSSKLQWDFGQPSSGSSNASGENDPSHHYGTDTGTYEVCLIASLPEGCADTICKTVFNDFTEGFGIYNVFTPGLIDGKNDQYDIQIENESLYELFIYDRWGKLVFEGHEDADNMQNKNWNGKLMNKGSECPSGTYYYIFRYALKQKPDDIITLHGVITLIR